MKNLLIAIALMATVCVACTGNKSTETVVPATDSIEVVMDSVTVSDSAAVDSCTEVIEVAE